MATLLYIIIGIYLFGLLGRLLLRLWLRRQQKKFENGEGPFFRTYSWGAGRNAARPETKKEGDVTYQQVSRNEKRVNTDVGDYVEFEEIKVTETVTDSERE